LRALDILSRFFALAAGVLLTGVTLMTCASLVGRNTTGWTIIGDFELTGAAAGAAIGMFLPLAQLQRGNIVVDFFTTRASPATKAVMDRMGAALLGAMMVLLTWRSALGGWSAWQTQSETMMLGLPEWWVYVGLVPPLALTAVIAFVQAARGFDDAGTGA
jgi:TRAP-type C4-dicarboxylate transport system permease small subunit